MPVYLHRGVVNSWLPTAVFLLVIAAVAPCAVAADFALDVDAQPLQVALISGLEHPAGDSTTFADTASGLRARANIYFLHLEFDFQHFYGQGLDWIHAGLGYEFVFAAGETSYWGPSRFVLRPQAGMLVLGGPSPAGGNDYQTQTGVRAGATLGWELALTPWLALEVSMDLGFIYLLTNGSFGYSVGVLATLGLRV